MGRTRRYLSCQPNAPHYIVIWDLQWRVVECRRVEQGSDLRTAFAQTLEQLERDGWRGENTPQFAFVFVIRDGERRLVTLTARDPFSVTLQSFSPFGAWRP
jgi:hypothetical protein